MKHVGILPYSPRCARMVLYLLKLSLDGSELFGNSVSGLLGTLARVMGKSWGSCMTKNISKDEEQPLCTLVKPTFPWRSGALLLFGRRISLGHLVGLRSLGPLTLSQPEEITFLSYAVSEVLLGHSPPCLTSHGVL